MARRAAPISQADVTRAVKGAVAAGIPVERIIGVKTTPAGVELVLGEPNAPAGNVSALDQWRSSRAG